MAIICSDVAMNCGPNNNQTLLTFARLFLEIGKPKFGTPPSKIRHDSRKFLWHILFGRAGGFRAAWGTGVALQA